MSPWANYKESAMKKIVKPLRNKKETMGKTRGKQWETMLARGGKTVRGPEDFALMTRCKWCCQNLFEQWHETVGCDGCTIKTTDAKYRQKNAGAMSAQEKT